MKLMLDSGAFHAWRKGGEIPLSEYIQFLKDNHNLFSSIVNMDVIPHSNYSKQRIEDCVKKSWDNYYHIISEVPKEKVIHIFHQGEDFRWLEKMMEEKIPYIGISYDNFRRVDEKIRWLNFCMSIIASAGDEIPDIHGFGASSPSLIYRYAWRSVDSSRVSIISSMGDCIIPMPAGYPSSYPVRFSERSGNFKSIHFADLHKNEKIRIIRMLKKYNIPLRGKEGSEGMMDSCYMRVLFSLLLSLEIQSDIKQKRRSGEANYDNYFEKLLFEPTNCKRSDRLKKFPEVFDLYNTSVPPFMIRVLRKATVPIHLLNDCNFLFSFSVLRNNKDSIKAMKDIKSLLSKEEEK